MAFKLQFIDKVPQIDNAFSDYGIFCHSLIERWAKNELPDIALAEAYKQGYADAVVHWFPPFPKGMPAKYYDAGLQYFETFQGFGDVDILAVEERFTLDIGGYPFVGVADLVLRDRKTGEITVIDHKSKSMAQMRKDLPTYRKQLYLYAAYVKKKYGVFPKNVKFNLFRERKEIALQFDEQEMQDTLDWVVRTIEDILFETDWKIFPSSYYCRFVCSVFGSCPAEQDILLNSMRKRENNYGVTAIMGEGKLLTDLMGVLNQDRKEVEFQ